jgi:uncharacterized repeat protein (TIGR01451 family)
MQNDQGGDARLAEVRWSAKIVLGLAVLIALWIAGATLPHVAAQGNIAMGITPTPTFTPTLAVTPTAVPEETPPAREPDVQMADPVITKRGEPSEAFPGELVTFVLEVTNLGNVAAVDVVVMDQVSEFLEILEVTTTQGEVRVDYQLVTVEVGTVGPEFLVEIVVRTRVRDDAPVPLDIPNVAELSSPNGGDRTTIPVTISVPSSILMPTTGLSTIRPQGALLILFAAVFVGVGLVGRRQR